MLARCEKKCVASSPPSHGRQFHRSDRAEVRGAGSGGAFSAAWLVHSLHLVATQPLRPLGRYRLHDLEKSRSLRDGAGRRVQRQSFYLGGNGLLDASANQLSVRTDLTWRQFAVLRPRVAEARAPSAQLRPGSYNTIAFSVARNAALPVTPDSLTKWHPSKLLSIPAPLPAGSAASLVAFLSGNL